jgi:hypothetical protein
MILKRNVKLKTPKIVISASKILELNIHRIGPTVFRTLLKNFRAT